MGFAKAAILFFALLCITACLAVVFPTLVKNKPTDAPYLDTNLSVNKTTGMIEPIFKTGGDYSSVLLIFSAILLIGAAFIFMSGRRRW